MSCNKTEYENEGLALITADYINKDSDVVAIYKCTDCQYWHLTSVN